MAVITIRLSKKDKAVLEECGKLPDVVRKAIRMYINNMEKNGTVS
jgi:flagellar basal body-associated protein FliL